MTQEQLIEKLKKENVVLYSVQFSVTSLSTFLFYETYFNEDKTRKVIQSYQYCPDLYMKKHKVRQTTMSGVYYIRDYIGFTSEDMDNGVEFHFDIDKYFETEEEAVNNYLKEQNKEIVLYDEKDKNIYTISTFFDRNTIEKVNSFIETMNKNGSQMSIIKGETK